MRRRRLTALMAAALAGALLLQACADPGAAPVAAPAQHPCGPEVDPATARVVDVYATMLRHLVSQPRDGNGNLEVLHLVDHAVPEFHPTGVPEWEKRTPAPASRSTAEFVPAVRRCLEGARLDGLLPVRLVEDWDDPAIRTEPLPVRTAVGEPYPGDPPRRIVDGRLFSLSGVPARGHRLAIAASSAGGIGYDHGGGLFVMQRRSGTWRVTDQPRTWVS
jgi:hypothetical protein